MIEAALGLFAFFFVYWWSGWRPGEMLVSSGPLYVMATTMSLAAIVACQTGNALACRSYSKSVLDLGLFSNPPLLLAIAAEVVLLIGLIYLPIFARLFDLVPLQPMHWLLLATFGPLVLLAEEARKLMLRLIPTKSK
jgi:Ca2+-transporting ATPase